MSRLARRELAQGQAFAQVVIIALVGFSLLVGGIQHFTDFLLPLLLFGIGGLVILGFLYLLWRHPWVQLTTKLAISLAILSALEFWVATELQSPAIPDGTVTGGASDFPLHLVVSIVAAIGAIVSGIVSWQAWLEKSAERAACQFPGLIITPAQKEPASFQSIESRLNKIDWYQFEKLVARLFELEGRYAVQRRGGSKADAGVDVELRKDGKLTIVQCKHWKTRQIRVSTIQQIIGIRETNHADEIILATTGAVGESASELAQANDVQILDEEELIRRIQAVGESRLESFLDETDKRCPKCDSVMVYRSGSHSPFWGCSQYGPRNCRGTIEISATDDLIGAADDRF